MDLYETQIENALINSVAIATRVSYLPSHFSRRANEYVGGKFYPKGDGRYTVSTPWGEQHFSTLRAAKEYAVIAKRSSSFSEACRAFCAHSS